MAEQALWHLKRLTLAIPLPSVAAMRRRAWMVGPPLLLGLLGAFIATQLQTPSWRGKAEVGFRVPEVVSGSATPPTLISGDFLVDPTDFFGDPHAIYLDAQARLARSTALASRVVLVAGVPGLSAAKFLDHSSAKPASDADILTLSVSYRPRAAAVRLTNAYATQFVRFKAALDSANLERVLRRLRARIRLLRSRGQAGTPAYENLLQAQQNLGVQLRSASVVKRANRASSFRPHALPHGLLGGGLGVLLGVGLTVGIAARRRRGNLGRA